MNGYRVLGFLICALSTIVAVLTLWALASVVLAATAGWVA